MVHVIRLYVIGYIGIPGCSMVLYGTHTWYIMVR